MTCPTWSYLVAHPDTLADPGLLERAIAANQQAAMTAMTAMTGRPLGAGGGLAGKS
jgi:hypothetical protein